MDVVVDETGGPAQHCSRFSQGSGVFSQKGKEKGETVL
jgi:hypothetical protein